MSKYTPRSNKDEVDNKLNSTQTLTENPQSISRSIENPKSDGIMAKMFARIGCLFRVLCVVLFGLLEKTWLFCSSAVFILLLAFWFHGGLITLILLHVAVIGILYNAQDMLLFHPDQPPRSQLFVDSPGLLGLHHEVIKLRTHDGVYLNVFFIKQPGLTFSSAPTIVYFHGNAGNIGHRLYNAQHLLSYCRVNVMLVEYRGYGTSTGSPSEKGLYIDAQTALDYVYSRADINQQAIIVFGRSLGGSVAIQACSQPYNLSRVAAMIVENTFTCLPEMARKLFDFRVVQCLPDFCHKNKFPSRSRVPNISIPCLFVSGQQDTLVPPVMMLSLFESCGSQMKRLALYSNGTHNETWQQPGYYDMMNKFLSEVWNMKRGERVQRENVFTVP